MSTPSTPLKSLGPVVETLDRELSRAIVRSWSATTEAERQSIEIEVDARRRAWAVAVAATIRAEEGARTRT
jgi:hypothetical protein